MDEVIVLILRIIQPAHRLPVVQHLESHKLTQLFQPCLPARLGKILILSAKSWIVDIRRQDSYWPANKELIVHEIKYGNKSV